ncbi:MAG TPA: hypothetical protein VGI65_16870 [Steroidobacteraceae bacterium]|jgi:hypothetical protein
MLSSVLNSARAITVNIEIMRVLVRLRAVLTHNRELARRFEQLQVRLGTKLAAQDEAIEAILSAIWQLMKPKPPKRRGIGFTADFGKS